MSTKSTLTIPKVLIIDDKSKKQYIRSRVDILLPKRKPDRDDKESKGRNTDDRNKKYQNHEKNS